MAKGVDLTALFGFERKDELQAVPIPMNEIFMDSEFNSRSEAVSPLDVIDLAKSIKKDGLQSPIIVHPITEHKTSEENKAKYKWAIIAGHRRFVAFQVNSEATIPCFVKQGLNEFQCRTLNAIENLKRKDLNKFEEALTIAHYKNAGWSRDAIAQEIGFSPGWVQIRCMMLDLEPEIQREIAAGVFNDAQIRDLHAIKEHDRRMDIAGKMKAAREKGLLVTADKLMKIAPKATMRKARKKQEMQDMINEIKEAFGEYNLATCALGWASGEVSNIEFYKELKEACLAHGIDFSIPPLSI